tara:strand:- start:6941 stop:7765 length:825 start_codon:yes stop_codon:yes gene_type:complete
MKILSIDVGMKNLAFCLFEITDSMEYQIIKWDVLNLCKDKEHLCKEAKKNNEVCNKKAKYFKQGCYYCKTHAKNKKYLIPDAKCNKYNLKKKGLTDLRNIMNKNNLEYIKKAKKKDLYQCILEYYEQKYFDMVSKTKTKDINLVTYGRTMREMFNKNLENIKIDIVCVENQIGPLALRMKTLQGMIMQHFIEKEIPLVEEISATNKLKEFLELKKTTYAERKKLSIQFTREILTKNNSLHKWIKLFNEHKKKDDLADSFLQGRWYLKNSILKNN